MGTVFNILSLCVDQAKAIRKNKCAKANREKLTKEEDDLVITEDDYRTAVQALLKTDFGTLDFVKWEFLTIEDFFELLNGY